jgi:hypothetical protein
LTTGIEEPILRAFSQLQQRRERTRDWRLYDSALAERLTSIGSKSGSSKA